ncbi:MAG: sigma-70 family RNA polymerase sigma factor [Planctomycetota bacterium]
MPRPGSPSLPDLDRPGAAREWFGQRVEDCLGLIYRLAFVRLGQRDPAEDATQETFLRAWRELARFRGDRPFESWLIGILRNVVSDQQRREGRRERARIRLEENASKEEFEMGALEDLERDEAERALWEAVSKLSEPLRWVVVLHYAEGQGATQIAERLGVSPAVVRKRLQLARERLKGDAGAKLGAAFLAVTPTFLLTTRIHAAIDLAPSAATGGSFRGPHVRQGMSLGGRLMIGMGLSSLVALVVWVTGGVSLSGSSADVEDAGGEEVVVASESRRSSTGEAMPRRLESNAESRRIPAALKTPSPAWALAPKKRQGGTGISEAEASAEIRGRLLAPDGSAVSGVELLLHGRPATQDRLAEHGEPDGWTDPVVETDEEGRFILRLDPPGAYRFELKGHRDGFVPVTWRWMEIAPSQSIDLGDIVLAKGGTITGTVIDEHGVPIPGEHQVTARTSYQPSGDGAVTTFLRTATDVRGGFILNDMPPGPSWVEVRVDDGPKSDELSVNLPLGGEQDVEIVVDMSAAMSRIRVQPKLEHYGGMAPAAGTIVLIDSLGQRRSSREARTASFEGVAPGSYTLEIDDPRFEPLTLDDVQPGDRLRPVLRGNASLVVRVRDDEGQPVERYSLDLIYPGAGFASNGFDLKAAGDPIPTGGRYESIVPGEIALLIEAEGFAPARRDLTLAPREQGEVTITLGRGTSLEGRVLGFDGEPAASIRVAIARKSILEAIESEPMMGGSHYRELREQAIRTETDENGRFRFDALQPGAWSLYARRAMYLDTDVDEVILEEGKTTDIEVQLPGHGFLQGRLLTPESEIPPGMELRADLPLTLESLAIQSPFDRAMYRGLRSIRGEIHADGTYRLGPLPSAVMNIVWALPPDVVPTTGGSSRSWSGATKELTRVEPRVGETLELDLDVRPYWPGHLEARVMVDGQPAAGLILIALQSDAGEDRIEEVVARFDVNGHTRLGPMLPGTWDLAVRPLDSSWLVLLPPQRIDPGETVEATWDLTTRTATVTFVDAMTDRPLAGELVFWGTPQHNYGTYADENGQLRLRLGTGTIEFFTDDFPPRRGSVEWTASGPTSSVIRMSVD